VTTTYNSILTIGTGNTVTISGVHFTGWGHASANGGAVTNNGTLTVESCIFSSNRATSGVSSNGGAIYNSGTLTVKGCTFYNNKANGQGGAIFNSNLGTPTAALTGNLFFGNTADGSNAAIPSVAAGGTTSSGGYNLTDVTIGNSTGESGWATGSTGDNDLNNFDGTTFTDNTVSPFTNVVVDFTPVDELKTFMPLTPIPGFPTTDFNGDDREWPGVPGAVNAATP
jgi:hypothetical protein